jgi:hypothetical protein
MLWERAVRFRRYRPDGLSVWSILLICHDVALSETRTGSGLLIDRREVRSTVVLSEHRDWNWAGFCANFRSANAPPAWPSLWQPSSCSPPREIFVCLLVVSLPADSASRVTSGACALDSSSQQVLSSSASNRSSRFPARLHHPHGPRRAAIPPDDLLAQSRPLQERLQGPATTQHYSRVSVNSSRWHRVSRAGLTVVEPVQRAIGNDHEAWGKVCR